MTAGIGAAALSPLSSAQERLWFLWKLRPDGDEYNVPALTRLRGPLDLPALRHAIGRLVERHQVLRAVFPLVDDAPMMRITDRVAETALVDLSTTPLAEREAALRALVSATAHAPFDLVNGPVFRPTVLRFAPEDHVLVLAFHHIAVDGWSLGLVDQELAAFYNARLRGEPDPATEPAAQYAEHVRAERDMLGGAKGREALEFWRGRLDGAPPYSALTGDRPHRSADYAGGVRGTGLDAALCADIQAVSRSHRVTRFLTFLAAYAALVHRTTGDTDIVIGVPVSGRTSLQVERVVGLFVNMMPIRVHVEETTSFAELLGRARDAFLTAHAYQDLPFQQMVEALRPERANGRHPVFQNVFAYEEPATLGSGLDGLEASGVSLPMHTAKFELTLHVEWLGEQARSAFGYQTAVFDDVTALRLAERYRTLLTDAVAAPETPVSRLRVLGPDEERTLLEEWPAGGPGTTGRVDRAFARRAAADPDAPAVRAGTRTFSYGALDRDTQRVAAALRALGVSAEAVVATCLPRGLDLVTAQLGAMRAHAAYLPLDPAHPAHRLNAIVTEARPALVITDREHAEAFADCGAPVRTLDELLAEGVAGDPPEAGSDPADLAYVIYTSGSTGRPKGVMVEHGALSGALDWYRAEFGLGPGDRTALVAAPGFDATVLDTWAALTSGATLEIPPASAVLDPVELRDWLLAREITGAVLPTPLVAELARLDWPAEVPLRFVLAGGDRLHPVTAPLPFRLVNGYGPTECTVCASAGTVPTGPQASDMPSIGRPVNGVTAYVLRPDLRPSPAGVPGELYLGGPCVARGYLGRPDLTAERFVPDPYGTEPGARLYRTGDRVRWRSDGTLDFLGRTDRQVKIRGFRVEPGEVEQAVLALPGIAEALVEPVAAAGAEPELVAYVVPGAPDASPEPAALRELLGRRLPTYMVPQRIVVVDSFARTVNGKIDRTALPAGVPAPVSRPPRTPMERTVADVWAEVLGHPRIGVDDNFFDVGGHSMRLLAVQRRLAARLERTVPIVDLYGHPTVAALARHLGDTHAGPVAAPAQQPPQTGEKRIQGTRRLRALRARNRQAETDRQ
ncbi:non-ribosomal peptide synthetase [Streptomyces kronopolitis]|uniref:non-ribosomal peptide synthetase n=1 Tax=Streptomyces kronopolitis TaxID=1612435 RepID=UPI0020C17CB7|nr:amino acid adenylation domain-containing protein [Streptomyces kronopolitis]MCL6299464.1 amino acid adenylation domain-containing protein [Streptomyces kronopolitis]